jgi:hypothetical protein
MPNLTRREILLRTRARSAAYQSGQVMPKRYPVAVRYQPPNDMSVTSVPQAAISADLLPRSEEEVRQQAYAQAKYDVVQASQNAMRPIGRKTFQALPEFKPAQRLGHDELGFVQVRRNPQQLSQAQDRVWADAYREGIQASKGEQASKEAPRITYWVEINDPHDPRRCFNTPEERGRFLTREGVGIEEGTLICQAAGDMKAQGLTRVIDVWQAEGNVIRREVRTRKEHDNTQKALAQNPLGRDKHIATATLNWDTKKERELSPFAPYVVIETKVDLTPKPSAMLHCDQPKRLTTSVGVDVLEQMRLERIAQLDSTSRF